LHQVHNAFRFGLLRTLVYSEQSSDRSQENPNNMTQTTVPRRPTAIQVNTSCFTPTTFHQRSISPSSIALISVRPAGVKGCKTQEVGKTHESLNGYYGTSRPPDSLFPAPSARGFAFLKGKRVRTHAEPQPLPTTLPPTPLYLPFFVISPNRAYFFHDVLS
jgi:hypothetical protein